jgi:transcriptional regulator with XRE-family HTH domain
MEVGEQIKRIRTSKGLSQKEVIMEAGLDKAQYSRIENGKTDPSVSTVAKIAKALGISLADLFALDDLNEVQSHDKTLMEKVSLMEELDEKEKDTIYNMLDAFLSKKKLKNALTNALTDI